jgi:hypothetical protein
MSFWKHVERVSEPEYRGEVNPDLIPDVIEYDFTGDIPQIVIEIFTQNNNVSISTLGMLSRTCNAYRELVQWRILKSRLIRNAYEMRFYKTVRKRFIAHPIEYTGSCVRVVSPAEMAHNMYGLAPMDVEGGLFTDEFLALKVPAFTNICFLAREPKKFHFYLEVAGTVMYTCTVLPQHYTSTGNYTEAELEYMHEKYDGNEDAYPGTFFVNLQLPTRINPLVLHPDLINMRTVRLCIGTEFIVAHGTVLDEDAITAMDLVPDPIFIGTNLTHAFMHFKTVDCINYVWSEYGPRYNYKINDGIFKHSLIKEQVKIRKLIATDDALPLADELLSSDEIWNDHAYQDDDNEPLEGYSNIDVMDGNTSRYTTKNEAPSDESSQDDDSGIYSASDDESWLHDSASDDDNRYKVIPNSW